MENILYYKGTISNLDYVRGQVEETKWEVTTSYDRAQLFLKIEKNGTTWTYTETVDLKTGKLTTCWATGRPQESDLVASSRIFQVSALGEEIVQAILEDLGTYHNAKYLAAKCRRVTTMRHYAIYRDEDVLCLSHFFILLPYNNSGIETLYDLDGHWTCSHIKKDWLGFTRGEKRTIINTVRSLIEQNGVVEFRKMNMSYKDVLDYAGDDSYVIRRRANQGLPESCKMDRKDYDWVVRHKNDTPHGRRAKINALCKKYTAYLEYEYTLERDVTEKYWRRNRNWLEVANVAAEARKERRRMAEMHVGASKLATTDDNIVSMYANKVCPPMEIEGFTFEVTNDPQKWRTQARVLHQCIIANGYYAMQNSTIVLCTKDGNPYATFEVKDHQIVQSYKDQHSEDIHVEAECTEACKKYIQSNNI